MIAIIFTIQKLPWIISFWVGDGTLIPKHLDLTGSITLHGDWQSSINRQEEVYLFNYNTIQK